MSKAIFYLLLVLGLTIPHLSLADEEAAASNMARFWAAKAKQQRAIKIYQRQARLNHMRRRRRLPPGTFIPPWVDYKEPNEDGKKELELEDMQLWASMDLDKDGKLTVAEFERFSRSPNAQAYVRSMKSKRAVEDWANKAGMDVEKARAAMAVGANAQNRRNAMNQHYAQRQHAARRQHAMQRQHRQKFDARQRAQNYWSRLGNRINPYLQQQYYTAMQRGGRRREEL